MRLSFLLCLVFFPLVLTPGEATHYRRVLFVGNSITHLYQYDQWPGGWGVSASQPDKDYVHRVQLALTARQGSIVEIGVQRADVGFVELFPAVRSRAATFGPDLVVVQVGDNANLDETTYKDNLRQLLDGICTCPVILTGVYYDGAGGTVPLLRSVWNAQVAAEVGAVFVPISDLYNGYDCPQRDYICTHPDDATMQKIADRIIGVIR